MVIEPGRIINDFIEPNKRQYAIPVYQRNYEWSKEQCIKLFNDIVQAYKKDKSHFCGSVVYALMKEEHNIHYYMYTLKRATAFLDLQTSGALLCSM